MTTIDGYVHVYSRVKLPDSSFHIQGEHSNVHRGAFHAERGAFMSHGDHSKNVSPNPKAHIRDWCVLTMLVMLMNATECGLLNLVQVMQCRLNRSNQFILE